MTDILQAARDVQRACDELKLAVDKVGKQYDTIRTKAAQLPHGLGKHVALPSSPDMDKFKQSLTDLQGIVPGLTPFAHDSLTLTEIAKRWRALEKRSMNDIIDVLDVTIMAGPHARDSWQSPAGDLYATNVRDNRAAAQSLRMAFLGAATALEEADSDIHNWFVGAAVAMITAIGALITLLGSMAAIFDAVMASITTILSINSTIALLTLPELIIALEAVSGPSLALVLTAVGAALVLIGAVAGFEFYMTSVVNGARDKIDNANQTLANSTPWKIGPRSDDW